MWQTHGDINGQFTWDEGWFQQATPPVAAMRTTKFSRSLDAGGVVNRS
ncbi:hypothetical protein ACFU51_11185 [Streptomyces sp. NPDC057430]